MSARSQHLAEMRVALAEGCSLAEAKCRLARLKCLASLAAIEEARSFGRNRAANRAGNRDGEQNQTRNYWWTEK